MIQDNNPLLLFAKVMTLAKFSGFHPKNGTRSVGIKLCQNCFNWNDFGWFLKEITGATNLCPNLGEISHGQDALWVPAKG